MAGLKYSPVAPAFLLFIIIKMSKQCTITVKLTVVCMALFKSAVALKCLTHELTCKPELAVTELCTEIGSH